MNPLTPKEAVLLAQKSEEGARRFKNCEAVIAVPFLFLDAIRQELKKAQLGGQDAFWAEKGAYTGEVSWRQLQQYGVKYAIVGHSERRIYLSETDETINKKVVALIENGMIPILCVGEREREGDDIPAIVGEQVRVALRNVKKNMLKNLVIAYEPIWAISSMPGAYPDTPDSAFRARMYIKRILAELYDRNAAEKARIIYGGSVRPENISSFLKEGKMDGALVGGASLNADAFLEILKQAR